MLTQTDKINIINGVINNGIPEFKKMMNSLFELKNFFKEKSMSVLNEREKNILEKYPKLIKRQPDINIDIDILASLEKLENNKLSEKLKDLNNIPLRTETYTYISKYWGYNHYITFKEKFTPFLFNNWKTLKDNYRDIYYESLNIIIEGLEYRKIFNDKLTLLINTLSKEYINLTLLKNNFVELYNFAKNGKK